MLYFKLFSGGRETQIMINSKGKSRLYQQMQKKYSVKFNNHLTAKTTTET